MQDELRETEQRMDLAASGAGLGLWMWDVARNEIWTTDKGRSLFGLAPTEKLDIEQFRSRIHPEDRDSVLLARTQSRSTPLPASLERNDARSSQGRRKITKRRA
jgi:PAS domain-containing protein